VRLLIVSSLIHKECITVSELLYPMLAVVLVYLVHFFPRLVRVFFYRKVVGFTGKTYTLFPRGFWIPFQFLQETTHNNTKEV
jgi:hypothetical protein